MCTDDSAGGDAFERERAYLFGVAYRLLGTVSEAEDVVQETYLRLQAAGPEGVRSPRAYLVTIATRLALDVLRSARRRREQYIGVWLPEPLVTTDGRDSASPAWVIERDESLSMAFLVLLEKLGPAERAVMVLRDVFDCDYAEIAEMLGKSPAACRQILHRARGRLAEWRRGAVGTDARPHELAREFGAAVMEGDLPTVLRLLSVDATAIGDGGGYVPSGKGVAGRENVARLMVGLAHKYGPGTAFNWRASVGEANGSPALITHDASGQVTSVAVLEPREGRIGAIYVVANPEKLGHVR